MTSRSDAVKIWQDLRGLSRIWPYLRSYKRELLIGAAFIPIISLLQMSLPLIIKWIIDEGVIPGNFRAIGVGASIYFGVLLCEYGSRGCQAILTAKAVHQMIRLMRDKLIGHIMRLSPSFHDKTMSGALVTRATSDFDNLSELDFDLLNQRFPLSQMRHFEVNLRKSSSV